MSSVFSRTCGERLWNLLGLLPFGVAACISSPSPGDAARWAKEDQRPAPGDRYAVDLAPTYSHPDIELTGGGNFIVDGGGDVNGDGFVDVLGSATGGWGAAYVYLGVDGSVDTTIATTFQSLENTWGDEIPIAFAGDVDGDGYDDIIASANQAALTLLYSGVEAGLGGLIPATWTLPDRTDAAYEVAWVDGAGDVNGDGYDDVVVGTPYSIGGMMMVHLGSPTGPLDDASRFEVDSATPEFGHTVRGAGDVNGDGYADVVVSGDAYSSAVYYGSAAGMSASAFTALNHASMARSVAGAGDVNGDGYDDVIVGMPDASPSGEVDLFLGAADGVAPEIAWSRPGPVSEFGWSVERAGDVNGDGFADVLLSAHSGGYVEVVLGDAMGLQVEPLARIQAGAYSAAPAGDIDRDGLDDVVVTPGRVFLGAALTDPNRADAAEDTGGDGDTDADADTDSDTDSLVDSDADDTSASTNGGSDAAHGCPGGKGGCDAGGAPPAVQMAYLGAVVVLRRRRGWGGRCRG